MSTININVLNSNELKIYTSLSEKQLFHYYEPESGLFIAESPKVIDRAARVSMGTVFQIDWAYCDDYIEKLHNSGFKLAATALDETALSISSDIFKNTQKLAIVMGNEGDGLTPETIASCDHTAYIPMMNGVDSLNVAASIQTADKVVLRVILSRSLFFI